MKLKIFSKKGYLCLLTRVTILVFITLAGFSGVSMAADSARVLALKKASTLRARIYGETGRWKLALAELEKLSKLFPEDRYVLSDLANACRRTGDPVRAEKIYRSLMKKNPEVSSYVMDLSYLMAEQGRYSEVVSLIDSRWKITPGVDREVVLLLAEASDRTGAVERATELYLFLLKQNPDDLPVILALADRYQRDNEREKAREAYTKVMTLDPQEIRAYKGMAATYADRDPDSYRLWLQKGYTVSDQDWEIAYMLGEYFSGRNDSRHTKYHEETLSRLDKSADKTSSMAGRARARCLWRLGRKQEAENLFRNMVASLSRKGSGAGAGSRGVRRIAASAQTSDAPLEAIEQPEEKNGPAPVTGEAAFELANDLAELLMEEKRYDEALKVLETIPGIESADGVK